MNFMEKRFNFCVNLELLARVNEQNMFKIGKFRSALRLLTSSDMI